MDNLQKKVKIIGLGIGDSHLPSHYKKMIEAAEILVGGDRFLKKFKEVHGKKIPIKAPIKLVIDQIIKGFESGKDVVVISDGDPGFFGIGKRIIKELGPDKVELFPNITVLQAATGKIGLCWDDIKTVSLHGRDNFQPLFNLLSREDKVALFTDPYTTPSFVAKRLVEKGVDGFKVYVVEDLGMDTEKITLLQLNDLINRQFSPLNFLIFLRFKRPKVPLTLGIDDEKFIHYKGLITKKEIRSIAIGLLNIESSNLVWDLGAGCGSVGIEISYLTHAGKVIAVEKDANKVEMIKENIKRFGAYGVNVILGEMPECLAQLPPPDRVFMGGGIEEDILEKVSFMLKREGVWVIHAVLLKSFNKAVSFFKKRKWEVEILQAQINKGSSLAGDIRLSPLNPVFIIKAIKPNKG